MSLIRNWPVMDNSGSPPVDSSRTPGVVIANVNVHAKSSIAIALPNIEIAGYQRFTTNRSAVTTSTTPTIVEKASTLNKL
jgi:hypothetical protein